VGLVVAGEALWVVTFGGMGYLFADQWEAVSALMGNLSGAVAAAALGLTGAGYLLRRAWLGRRGLRSAIQGIIQHVGRGHLHLPLNPQHAGY
jgi:hypothetical protein